MRPRYLPLLSVALYLVSCFLPVLTFQKTGGSSGETWMGYHALLMGWMGVMVAQPAWFANPLWFAGSIFLIPNRGRIVSILLCSFALLLALPALSLVGNEVPADEGGVLRQRVQQLHAGAYVWILSIACQVVVGLYAAISEMRKRRNAPTASGSESSRSSSTNQ